MDVSALQETVSLMELLPDGLPECHLSLRPNAAHVEWVLYGPGKSYDGGDLAAVLEAVDGSWSREVFDLAGSVLFELVHGRVTLCVAATTAQATEADKIRPVTS